ncbi:MAG TPA: hypothetical protein VFB89_06885 [Gemmatimonadales bacterium]|nr:hypothetical protein [Gemmatimonadales bacterium]
MRFVEAKRVLCVSGVLSVKVHATPARPECYILLIVVATSDKPKTFT